MATARGVLPRPGLPRRVSEGAPPAEAGGGSEPLQTGLLAMCDLLGHEHGEEVAVRPLLLLRLLGQGAVDTRCVGEMQPAEERIERNVGGLHRASSCCDEAWAS